MKLEVGMYVRSEKGLLGKLLSKEKDGCGFILKYEGQYNKKVWSSSGTDSEITKASFNIIDLIEVGDILKIHLYSEICCIVEVDEIKYEDGFKYIGVYIPWHEGSSFEELKDLDIREVLAKEQFDFNCYKVGE